MVSGVLSNQSRTLNRISVKHDTSPTFFSPDNGYSLIQAPGYSLSLLISIVFMAFKAFAGRTSRSVTASLEKTEHYYKLVEDYYDENRRMRMLIKAGSGAISCWGFLANANEASRKKKEFKAFKAYKNQVYELMSKFYQTTVELRDSVEELGDSLKENKRDIEKLDTAKFLLAVAVHTMNSKIGKKLVKLRDDVKLVNEKLKQVILVQPKSLVVPSLRDCLMAVMKCVLHKL